MYADIIRRNVATMLRSWLQPTLGWTSWALYSVIDLFEGNTMPDMSEIEVGLFMGGAIHSRPANIHAILDMQVEHEDRLSPTGLNAFLWLPLLDIPAAAPGPVWIDNAVNTVIGWRALHWSVLVHCKAGHSRSGLIVVAYIMKMRHISRDAALAIVKSRRAVAAPNSGFMASLLEYQELLGIS
jgi:hypothetical protein